MDRGGSDADHWIAGKFPCARSRFGASRFVALRLDPGEDVLLSLRAAVEELKIRNAAILSGVGSLDRYHFHVVKTTNMPPGNTFVQGEGPFDILTVTGLVVDGKIHAHITFSNTDRQWAAISRKAAGCSPSPWW